MVEAHTATHARCLSFHAVRNDATDGLKKADVPAMDCSVSSDGLSDHRESIEEEHTVK